MIRVAHAASTLLVMSSVLACILPNPAFDERQNQAQGETSLDSGSTEQDTGDADLGDGDGDPSGDGDGDPPGDGDGDPPGDGDGDGDPTDPECEAPSGGFMTFCSSANPVCEVGVCLLVNDEQKIPIPGYCTKFCVTDQECNWGSQGQCTNDNLACVSTLNGQGEYVCELLCEVPEDCYPNQVCSPSGLCHPLG